MVHASEAQLLRRFTPWHVELVTKRQNLSFQRHSRLEQSDQRQPDQAADISHKAKASPDSSSLASQIGFPITTGVQSFGEKRAFRRI